jgi:WD40 repeat protein
VKVWDAHTGKELLSLEGHTNMVVSVAFSPGGTRLASASGDRTVKVWDARTGKELFTLKGHTNWLGSVAFSPDGQRLVSASGDKTVKVWDVQTGRELLTLKDTAKVSNAAFSPDGHRLVTVSSGVDVLEMLLRPRYSDGLFRLMRTASGDARVKVWDATPLPRKR